MESFWNSMEANAAMQAERFQTLRTEAVQQNLLRKSGYLLSPWQTLEALVVKASRFLAGREAATPAVIPASANPSARG